MDYAMSMSSDEVREGNFLETTKTSTRKQTACLCHAGRRIPIDTRRDKNVEKLHMQMKGARNLCNA